MKKLGILVIIGIVCLTSMAKAGVPDYVVCEDGVRYFEKVRFGLNNCLAGISESGREAYQFEDIISFRRNGRVYEKMPVIRNNKETGRYDFLELVAYRNGMKVFIDGSGVITGRTSANYIVYQDGKYVVTFDVKNNETLANFFFRPDLVALDK
jgi:hypothetical protein